MKKNQIKSKEENIILTSIGFTLAHDGGKCEVILQTPYDAPTVFVVRNRKKNWHGFADLDWALEHEAVVHVASKSRIKLLDVEMEFLFNHKPLFSKLETCDAKEVWQLIMQVNSDVS